MDFQALAELRLKEATVLLNAGLYEGTYYLVGYAIECALKACIAKQTSSDDFPPSPDLVHKVYSHKLAVLLEVAGLDASLRMDSRADSSLDAYWVIVKDWSEQSRYERRSLNEANELYRAIVDPDHGVLQWIQKHW
jgi:HEPN domain-containing protein